MIMWRKKGVNNRINNNKTITRKYFKYETKLTGSTPDDNDILAAEVVFPSEYLINFWRFHDLLLINREMKLENLLWS